MVRIARSGRHRPRSGRGLMTRATGGIGGRRAVVLEFTEAGRVQGQRHPDHDRQHRGPGGRADRPVARTGVAAVVGRSRCARATRVRLGADPGRDRLAARALAARPRLRARSPTTEPAARPCWIRPGSPGPAGGSRNACSRPRTKPGSTTTRSGPGARGVPTSPCRCRPAAWLAVSDPWP